MEHLPQTEPGQDEMEDKIALNEVSSPNMLQQALSPSKRLDLNHG